MKRFTQTFVIAIAVTSVFASFASAEVFFQDDESGYQIYQNLGGEVTAALAADEANSSGTQDTVDQKMAWAFGKSAYQTSQESCLVASAANARALDRFDALSNRISFE